MTDDDLREAIRNVRDWRGVNSQRVNVSALTAFVARDPSWAAVAVRMVELEAPDA